MGAGFNSSGMLLASRILAASTSLHTLNINMNKLGKHSPDAALAVLAGLHTYS